ncbi:MAG: hypothetical protein HFE93_04850 [Acutalibacter muris]|jgi:hypothetical protein|uniref:hypothetical protein n=1 Tax=Acutalibacter muris TaxID=1796620 RepID=UPI00272E48C8|nr:hypothetical protein [Acutalibacter muris]MCI9543510.1 hypothetical protein [Acutalibacter muris]
MSAPNLKELEWAISELEKQESSESRYILLAALYTCRSQMLGSTQPEPRMAAYYEAVAPEPLGQYGDSEFLRAVAEKPSEAAWAVMDELMETLRVVNGRAYQSVMRKLSKL